MRLLLALLMALLATPALAQPLVLAHRGASGERPEHTRAAYELAIEQGADFIEPDLVMTRDGVLIVRHENEIGGTTDVADRPQFAARRTTKTVDGQSVTGWFTEDFTLAELKTLKGRERLPDLRPANTAWRDEDILTLAEVIRLVQDARARTGRDIGLIPELKHPSYFAAIGLPMIEPLLRDLAPALASDRPVPVIVQSFEIGVLQALAPRTDLRLMQLMSAAGGPADQPGLTYAAMATPAGLQRIADYADWVGVETRLIEPQTGQASTLVADAHAAGLAVAAWTFRAEPAFLPETDQGRFPDRLRRFAGYGLDALFTDHPGEAANALSTEDR